MTLEIRDDKKNLILGLESIGIRMVNLSPETMRIAYEMIQDAESYIAQAMKSSDLETDCALDQAAAQLNVVN